jgi:colicin import membrane protein
MKLRNLPWLAVALVVATGAHAASDERAAIRQERKVIEADYARREAECRTQFVVTPCLEKVRREKVEALNTVNARESAVDSAERLERAGAQKRRLAAKAAASQAQAAAPAASQAHRDKTRPTPAPRKAAPKPAPDPAERQSREAASRAAFDARQREIEAHRAEVEKRNAERAKRKAAKPLPLPASG